MATMYDIQSPESIAKEYGGNKQRIAQAAQGGMIDPTAAVMAGMYIDRMSNAQAAQASAPLTVAQQVLNPPNPRPAPAGTQYSQQGLPSIPSNAQYSDGGIVGYAVGGLAEGIEQARRKATKYGQTPFPEDAFAKEYDRPQDVLFSVYDRARSGLAGLMENTFDPPAPEVYDPHGVERDPESVAISEGSLLPDGGGEGLDYAIPDRPAEETPPAPIGVPGTLTGEPRIEGTPPFAPAREAAEAEEYMRLEGDYPELEAYREYLKGEEGRQDKRRRDDFWSAVAQFGFNMAGSESPYLYQAAGEAGSKTMPFIQESTQAQRDAKRTSRKGLAELDMAKRKSDDEFEKARLSRQTQLDVAKTQTQSGLEHRYLQAKEEGDVETMRTIEKLIRMKTRAPSGAGFARIQFEARKLFQEQLNNPRSSVARRVKELEVSLRSKAKAEQHAMAEFEQEMLGAGGGGIDRSTVVSTKRDGNIIP